MVWVFCGNLMMAAEPQDNLSAKDKVLLFGDVKAQANVAISSEEEMNETTGESWLVYLGVSALVYGLDWGMCKLGGGKDCSFKLETSFPF